MGLYLGNPMDPPFNSATIDQTVYYENSSARAGDRAQNPGTNATRATYIACHTWHGPGGHSACNVIDQALRVGDDVYAMTTASKRLGVWLHYVVTARPIYDSLTSYQARSVWLRTPRLMLITCHLRDDGRPQDHNRVIFTRPVGVSQLNMQ